MLHSCIFRAQGAVVSLQFLPGPCPPQTPAAFKVQCHEILPKRSKDRLMNLLDLPNTLQPFLGVWVLGLGVAVCRSWLMIRTTLIPNLGSERPIMRVRGT